MTLIEPAKLDVQELNEGGARFIAIILGADAWPMMPTLKPSIAYQRSRDRLKRYMIKELGLKDGVTLLDLFNSDASNTLLDQKIREFLIGQSKDNNPTFSDLILYYVGHGDVTTQDQRFQVILRSTNLDQKDYTGYQIRLMAETLKKHAYKVRKYIILDCCYARAALPDFLLQAGDAIEDIVPQKIHQEARVQLLKDTGTVLLCAAGEDQWGFVPEFDNETLENSNDALTMFTYGLVNTLDRGIDDAEQNLNIQEIYDHTVDLIASRFPQKYVKPVLDAAKGDREKLTQVRVFPNPAKHVTQEELRLRKLEYGLEKAGSMGAAILQSVDTLRSAVDEYHDRLRSLEQKLQENTSVSAIENSKNRQGFWRRLLEDNGSQQGVWSQLNASEFEWRAWPPGVRDFVLMHYRASVNGMRFFFANVLLISYVLAAYVMTHESLLDIISTKDINSDSSGAGYIDGLPARFVVILFILQIMSAAFFGYALLKRDNALRYFQPYYEDNPPGADPLTETYKYNPRVLSAIHEKVVMVFEIPIVQKWCWLILVSSILYCILVGFEIAEAVSITKQIGNNRQSLQ